MLFWSSTHSRCTRSRHKSKSQYSKRQIQPQRTYDMLKFATCRQAKEKVFDSLNRSSQRKTHKIQHLSRRHLHRLRRKSTRTTSKNSRKSSSNGRPMAMILTAKSARLVLSPRTSRLTAKHDIVSPCHSSVISATKDSHTPVRASLTCNASIQTVSSARNAINSFCNHHNSPNT